MLKKSIILFSILCIVLTQKVTAQVTIGVDKPSVKGALLDLKESVDLTGGEDSKKGLGMARVALSKINYLFPMFGQLGSQTNNYDTKKSEMDIAHTGLLVYNVTTDLPEGLCPGLYVWKGNIWERLPEPCPAALTIENSPNSFIVASGGSVEIPCGKPYIVAQSRSDVQSVNLTDKVTLEVLWQDTQNLIDKVELTTDNKGPYSKFKVTTKSGTGNAVVAVRMGANGNTSDPIVWSWHIWVTDYNPSNGGKVYSHSNGEQTYLFMDRNLGATIVDPSNTGTIGLFYQWGRKDPFSPSGAGYNPLPNFKTLYSLTNTPLTELDEIQNGASGTGIKHELATDAISGAANNLSRSIKNPMTFFYGIHDDPSNNQKPLDWYNIADNDAAGDSQLWTASGDKSPFDPCPDGWRVPAYSATKSPWAHFIGDFGPWGFGPTADGDLVLDATTNALLLNAKDAVTEMGLYPLSPFRRAREYYIGGAVGSSTSYGIGGYFLSDNSVDADGRENLTWTANTSTTDATAKAFAVQRNSMGAESKMLDYSRGAGGYVRCVKE